MQATESAPFANGELGLAEELGHFGGRIPFLDRSLLHEKVQRRFHLSKALHHLVDAFKKRFHDRLDEFGKRDCRAPKRLALWWRKGAAKAQDSAVQARIHNAWSVHPGSSWPLFGGEE